MSPDPDDGFTLVELLVSLVIMAMVMALASSGLYVMYRTMNRTEAAAQLQYQTVGAFNRLDREIRYAKRIFEPRVYGSDWTVSYLVSKDSTTSDECVQLLLDPAARRLSQRRWPPDTTAGPFTILAEQVVPAGSDPFVVPDAHLTTSNYDVLRIKIDSLAPGTPSGTRRFEAQYTALNTVDSRTEIGTTCTAAPK